MNSRYFSLALAVGLLLASSAASAQQAAPAAPGGARAATAPGVTRAVRPADNASTPTKVVDGSKPETAKDDQKSAPETATDDPPVSDVKKAGEVKQGVRSNTPP